MLRAAGGLAAGSVTVAGLATGDADDCVEVVDEERMTFTGSGTLGVGGVTVGSEETSTFGTEAFADSRLPERRLDGTATWNGGGTGPSNLRFSLQHRGDDGWTTVAVEEGALAGENVVEMTVADGEDREGADGTAVVADGESYRFLIEAVNGTVYSYDIQVAFEAFDPDC